MNKLKALLIAGLLTLTSVSFASTVSYTPEYDLGGDQAVADGAQAGTFNLDYDNVVVGFTGYLATSTTSTTTSAWYDLILGDGNGSSDLINFGWAYNTAQPNDLTIQFFSADGLTQLSQAFMGDFSILLATNTTYRMLLSGAEGRSYDGEISAVPVPAAGILFASALLGAGALGRRKKKAKASVVGAFARAS